MQPISRAAGFTIVELVAVIVLLAALSGVAISRMVVPSAFTASTVAHQFDGDFRSAQNAAAIRQDAQVSFEFALSGDEWRLRSASDVDGILRETLLERENTDVVATIGAVSGSMLTDGALSVVFDGLGDLASASIAGTAADPSLGIELQINGDNARTLCVYPTGYVAHAACL